MFTRRELLQAATAGVVGGAAGRLSTTRRDDDPPAGGQLGASNTSNSTLVQQPDQVSFYGQSGTVTLAPSGTGTVIDDHTLASDETGWPWYFGVTVGQVTDERVTNLEVWVNDVDDHPVFKPISYDGAALQSIDTAEKQVISSTDHSGHRIELSLAHQTASGNEAEFYWSWSIGALPEHSHSG